MYEKCVWGGPVQAMEGSSAEQKYVGHRAFNLPLRFESESMEEPSHAYGEGLCPLSYGPVLHEYTSSYIQLLLSVHTFIVFNYNFCLVIKYLQYDHAFLTFISESGSTRMIPGLPRLFTIARYV